ncbi:FliM/FliN family flagellar motor switch protein [Burkholderia ubonensis]|uniref:FliM/FliN family flagellar motor switch protein n=1 Tax=Burkholderia ubonensis TaxID=101571 RepID=UPI00075C67C2|nr:FliM/FliN family flagellar motor switch protein [Burkholderia ubonensis]KWB79403.1 flagellar motor switch protein FliN [Burkholderia ubonensis]
MEATEPKNDAHVAIDDLDLDQLFDETPAEAGTPGTEARPARDKLKLLAKIPLKLTLEVGSTTLSLAEVLELDADSVLELDRLAGEPLVITANGVAVGHAEVVVSGENYGLRVLEMGDLGGLVA